MKKISIILLSILCPSSLFAQETLSLQQCREMALQYNKGNGGIGETDRKCPVYDEKL